MISSILFHRVYVGLESSNPSFARVPKHAVVDSPQVQGAKIVHLKHWESP
jgi:hypothetical protein